MLSDSVLEYPCRISLEGMRMDSMEVRKVVIRRLAVKGRYMVNRLPRWVSGVRTGNREICSFR